jgi:hypothetical protein
VLVFIIYLGSLHGSAYYNSLVYYVGEDQFKERDIDSSYSTNVRMRNAYKDMDRKPERIRPWETFVLVDSEDIILGGLTGFVCVRMQSHDGHV